MYLTKKSLMVATASLMLAAQANAGGYLGAGFGITSPDESGFDDSNGLRLSAGYQFHENFAFQVSYVDLGEFDAESSLLQFMNREFQGMMGAPTVESASIEISGFDFSLVAMLPFNEAFTGFARLGVFSWDTDMNFDISVDGMVVSFSESESDNDFSFGLGLEYSVSENWSLVGEITTYEAFDGDISFYNVGANFRF